MAAKHQAPRGTRDLLPDELDRWQWSEARTREVVARYGYREIRTPMFEDYELFARTSGESSDVVQKEMYRFQDLKGRDLALRPEGTASVARAYLERGADVPIWAAAEGALPPVLPDRRRGDRYRRAGGGRRDHRAVRGSLRSLG